MRRAISLTRSFLVSSNEDEVFIIFYNNGKEVKLFIDITNQDISWIGRFEDRKWVDGGEFIPWPDGLKGFMERLDGV
jgi:hypothetical protein